jgi:site-specific DNA-cytosine methylase
VAELLAFWPVAPDCVFLSPPCKSFSGLLAAAKARAPKYRALNRLVLRWTELMLEAWGGNLPGLVLIENVPRIATRGRHLLRKVRSLLHRAGYVFHEQTHDCGELGGLAEHRRRFLLVARLPARVSPLLYQPPRRRVRGCGEVLGELPMPNDPAGGPMHVMPRLSWRNWIRLALTPAGGDWRDLNRELGELERRSQGGVANLRIGRAFDHGYRVLRWDEPSFTVHAKAHPGTGAYTVADIRVTSQPRSGSYGVIGWTQPANTVTGVASIDNGSWAVADPRRPDAPPIMMIGDLRKPPLHVPVIIAADGTWHRPLTTLELAALQGIPTVIDGKPLVLAGTSSTAWRERIGNAVPPPAARAIAEQMLIALVEEAENTMLLRGGGAVWVRPELHDSQAEMM